MPTMILAIDDSKTMRLAIKITFAAAEGTKVVAISRGSEAISRARDEGAAVVLVDHSLASGEPTGFEVCRGLKADPATAHIPVVLMVPAHGGVSQTEIQGCGADASIRKPFDTQELIDTVEQLTTGASAPARATAAAPTPRPAVNPAQTHKTTTLGMAAVSGVASNAAAKPKSTILTSRPVAAPMRSAPARSAAAVSGAIPGTIPLAIPIPFAPAGAPTSGMLERLKAAGAGGASIDGLDPQAVNALLKLTNEVVEQVVWEVVPELAEQLIREKNAN